MLINANYIIRPALSKNNRAAFREGIDDLFSLRLRLR